MTEDKLENFMLGSMLGDSIGLPFEGMSEARVQRVLGYDSLRHKLLFGCGMVSDDTEHMLMAAKAWEHSGGDVEAFSQILAWRLRFWMLALPAATGLATGAACLKLIFGAPRKYAGSKKSAGNGPIMRSGILGLLCSSDQDLKEFVISSSLLTHREQRAIDGALVVALAAQVAAQPGSNSQMRETFKQKLQTLLPQESEMRRAVLGALDAVKDGISLAEYVNSIAGQKKLVGFVMYTVPVAIHIWASNPADFQGAIERSIRLGGDTDTLAATVGGLVGIRAGKEQMPKEWLDKIIDYPNSVAYVQKVAAGLLNEDTRRKFTLRFLAQPPRNLIFLGIALSHGFMRLIPKPDRTR